MREQHLLPLDRSPLFPADEPQAKYRVHVCRGPNCSIRGSAQTLACFEERVHELDLNGEIDIVATSCRDRCDWGPSVNVFPGPVLYAQVDCAAVEAIIAEHLKDGRPVDRLKFDQRLPGRKR